MPEPLWGSGIDSTHGAGVGSMHLGGDEASNAVQSTLLLRACCTSTAQSFGKPAGIGPVHFAPIAAPPGEQVALTSGVVCCLPHRGYVPLGESDRHRGSTYGLIRLPLVGLSLIA